VPRLGEFKGAGCDASEQPQEGGEQQDEDHGWLRGCAGALNQAHQALLNDCNQPRQQDGQDDRSGASHDLSPAGRAFREAAISAAIL